MTGDFPTTIFDCVRQGEEQQVELSHQCKRSESVSTGNGKRCSSGCLLQSPSDRPSTIGKHLTQFDSSRPFTDGADKKGFSCRESNPGEALHKAAAVIIVPQEILNFQRKMIGTVTMNINNRI
jgi:hypothetical protein